MNRSAAVFLLVFMGIQVIWISAGAQTTPSAGAQTMPNAGVQTTPNAGDLYKQGVAAYERKDFPSAIRSFTQVLRLAPSDAETANLRGMCYYRLKQYALAIQDFDRTLQLDTGYQKNYFYRGSCKLALQDYPGAMADFDRQVVLFPSDPYNFNNLGYVKNALGDYPGSIQALIQALIIKPDYGAAYLNKGIAEYNMEDYSSALIDLQKGLTFKADSGDCYFYMGEVLDRKSEPVEACRDLMHAKKLHQEKAQKIPSMACEKWLVAQRYYDSAMEKKKEEDYSATSGLLVKAIETWSGDAGFFAELGEARFDLKDMPGALLAFTKAIHMDSSSVKVFMARAYVRDQMSDYTGALRDMNKCISLAPTDKRLHFYRGLTEFDMGRWAASVADFNTYLNAFPEDNPSAYGYKGRAEYQLKQYAQAKRDFTGVLMLDSTATFAYAYADRALCEVCLGDTTAGMRDLNRSLELDPSSTDFHYFRGQVFGNLGDYQRAVEDFDFILKSFPDNLSVLLSRAQAKEELDDKVGACADYHSALKYGAPPNKDMEAYCKP
jgi:tetratricopeptide (TPR) repeat protein